MIRPVRKMLVAVKDARGSNAALLGKVSQLARATGARVELFHALTEPLPVDASMFARGQARPEVQARQAYLRRLESLAAPLRRKGLEVSTAAEWDFPAHDALIRRALRTKADLIVAQRHDSRHVAPWFLRYTDWELLRRSPVPVLLIKTTRRYTSTGILAAIDPGRTSSKAASLDDAILRHGARLASATRGQLHVVHAYVPTLVDLSPAELNAPDATAQINAHAARTAQRGFEKALRKAGLGKLGFARRHLLVGHAVNAIPALADRLHCGVVVMGAVSRSGLKRLAFGNTAERLLDDLPCDLLVVKPPGFVSSTPKHMRGPLRVVLPPPGAAF